MAVLAMAVHWLAMSRDVGCDSNEDSEVNGRCDCDDKAAILASGDFFCMEVLLMFRISELMFSELNRNFGGVEAEGE